MKMLDDYEKQSSQKINKRRVLNLYIARLFRLIFSQRRNAQDFPRANLLQHNLGVQLSMLEKARLILSELIMKLQNKLQVWKGKILSFRDRAVLIKNVLQSISVYPSSTLRPPKCVIHDLYILFSKFLQNFKENGRNKHWVAWSNVYLPKNEGGL